MAEHVYPAIFHPNEDGTFTIVYPDLPGCISEGKSLGNAIYMAQTALAQWISYLADKEQEIPQASNMKDIEVDKEEFVSLVRVDIRDGRAVKRTVSIPQWMDDMVAEAGLSLSRVLQEALKEKLDTN